MSLLQTLLDKYAAAKQHHLNFERFKKQLFAAVEDGVLTDDEIDQLEASKAALGISDEEVRKIRVKAYEIAFRTAKTDGSISRKEEAELNRIQLALSIPDAELVRSRRELSRLRLIAEIQIGNLPALQVPSLILQKAEQAHWAEPASLIEERVVGRRYVGGSHGVSFRIAKGVSYRVGSSRGRLIVDKENVPVSSGALILTNKRVIFRGDKKSFNYRLDKLLDVQLYADGTLITDSAGKPRMVSFHSSDNADIVGSIMTQAINHFVASS